MRITENQLRQIIREEAQALDDASSGAMLPRNIQAAIMNAARDGDRVVFTGADGTTKTLWPGLGNRGGLHSYASELISQKWDSGKDRLQKKVRGPFPTGMLEIQQFRNVTRDRGRWVTVTKHRQP